MTETQAPTFTTRHIMRVFREASREDLQAGLVWYASARMLAAELDPTDPIRAAAVIAVLSPLKSWPQNVKLARAAYAGEPIRTLGDHVRKVERLLAGGDPYEIVSGPKVIQFWLSIIDPDNPRSVAVDRHALAIAAGRSLDRSEHVRYGKARTLANVAELYVRAARIASRETGEHWTPCAMQAATWVSWRHNHARAFHGD